MTLRVRSVSGASTLLMVLSSSFFFFFSSVAAAPYQRLMPRTGYIPVYIRLGDMPLEDIDPKLAAAFNEIEVGNSMLENVTNPIVISEEKLNNSDEIIVEAAKQPDHQGSVAKEPLVVVGVTGAEETLADHRNNNNNNEVTHLAGDESITEQETDVASFAVVKATNEMEKNQ